MVQYHDRNLPEGCVDRDQRREGVENAQHSHIHRTNFATGRAEQRQTPTLRGTNGQCPVRPVECRDWVTASSNGVHNAVHRTNKGRGLSQESVGKTLSVFRARCLRWHGHASGPRARRSVDRTTNQNGVPLPCKHSWLRPTLLDMKACVLCARSVAPTGSHLRTLWIVEPQRGEMPRLICDTLWTTKGTGASPAEMVRCPQTDN